MNVQWILLGVLVVLLFSRSRFVTNNNTYLDKDTTSTINGFFICVIFLSHFAQYCGEVYCNEIGSFFGQLVVAMFLFYSGYGCAVQYRSRGNDYLRAFPKKRILTTLVNFDIAVCVFIVVGLLLGRSFALRQVVCSFIGWDSVGNSAWYIFVILLCYAAFWVSFGLPPPRYHTPAPRCSGSHVYSDNRMLSSGVVSRQGVVLV